MSFIDWSKVNVFHMDEYLGLEPSHSASFPAFLRRHFLANITPKAFFPVVSHNRYPEDVCQEYAAALRSHPADLCALGIGENGHLAFNDPPFAEFNDPAWVKVIRLAEASRKQQVGEGHFKSITEVPTHAITLTIPALLAAKRVLAIVPEARKADAVYCSLRGPISEDCPGSILRRTAHAQLFSIETRRRNCDRCDPVGHHRLRQRGRVQERAIVVSDARLRTNRGDAARCGESG